MQEIHAIYISSNSNLAPSMHLPLGHPVQSALSAINHTPCAGNSLLWFHARPTCSSLLQKRPTVGYTQPHSGVKQTERETDHSPPWEWVGLYLQCIYTMTCTRKTLLYFIYCKSTIYFHRHNNMIYLLKFNITCIIIFATCFDSYESSSGINFKKYCTYCFTVLYVLL